MTLREIINGLENTSDELVIFATKKEGVWDLDAPGALVFISDMEKIGTDLEELHYFLEIEVAQEVLDVWTQWNNNTPTNEDDRTNALIYYAENDAYLNPT